jgi:hypothetical protein
MALLASRVGESGGKGEAWPAPKPSSRGSYASRAVLPRPGCLPVCRHYYELTAAARPSLGRRLISGPYSLIPRSSGP